ncbi:MAG: BlaI/MecI/CopY family transcriptional regulator [candidate division Zixibacteria bacterium]
MTDRQSLPTDAELEILNVLWANGPSTVKDVHQLLSGKSPRGYTTVLKILQIMSEKGLVSRDESQRAHIYTPAIEIKQTQQSMVIHLVNKVFDGSAGSLIMQALSSRPTSKEELAEIRKLLDEMEGRRDDK